MKISLASSLHLNHGAMSPDVQPGDPLPMLEYVPVGLLSLKAYADQFDELDAEIRVTELNGLINRGKIPNDNDFFEHVADTILKPDDDFVGLMTDADSLHHTVALADQLRRRRPEAKICLGGPASSPMSPLLMNSFPFIDFVVRGEGEQTFAELIRHLQEKKPLNEVQGLTWRDGMRVVENPERHLEGNLDELPVPDFESYGMPPTAAIYLDVGRGCPFKCSFCATAPFWGRTYRMKSIERIVEEIVLMRDVYGRTQVNLSHDIFTCDKKWALEFCDQLIKSPLGVEWTCSTRTDIIDPTVIEKLAAAGCVEIYFGIESGSARLQKEIEKGLDLDWSRDMVQATADAGIRVVSGFILGYPAEDRETLGDTLSRFFEFLGSGARAHLFTLSPFFESPMYSRLTKNGAADIKEHIDRLAEYYDLNLTGRAAEAGASLRRNYVHVFASNYRYKTSNLPSDLIDASEEFSASATLLKSVWPRFLKHYGSAREFYEKWTAWIEGYNLERRPESRFRHQAAPDDLLSFVEKEIDLLGASEPGLNELVRYERLKLDARSLQDPIDSSVAENGDVGTDTVVKWRSNFLTSEFEYDVQSLLSGKTDPAGARRWVVVYKVAPDQLNTVQLGDSGLDVLKGAEHPIRAAELIGDTDAEVGSQIISQLIRVGVLMEVEASEGAAQ